MNNVNTMHNTVSAVQPRMAKVITVLAAGLVSAVAHGASFDCAVAKTHAERFVCDNPAISKLDEELAKVYQDDLAKAYDNKKQLLIAQQQHWLKYTRDVCTTEACFKHAYWSRLAELETFFESRLPLLNHEVEKAGLIRQIITSTPLHEATLSDSKLCRGILEDLRQATDVHFVEPVATAQSYEDSVLDIWRAEDKRRLPLTADITCQSNLLDADPDGSLGICPVVYGLPPFKLFELPGAGPSGRSRHFIYYDGTFGPMNQERNKPSRGDFGAFKQVNIPTYDGVFAYASGGQPSYNAIIEYKHSFYFVLISNFVGSFSLRIESVKPNRATDKEICNWSPVETPPVGSRPRKPIKPTMPGQEEK